MTKDLIKKAKTKQLVRRLKNTVTDEEIELAIAWANDEISLTQVAFALDMKTASGNVLYYLASFLREGFRKGIIK